METGSTTVVVSLVITLIAGLRSPTASAQDILQLRDRYLGEIAANRYADAEATARRILQVTETAEHPKGQVQALSYLSTALIFQGRYSDADFYLLKASDICRRDIAPSDDKCWMTYNLLGHSLMKQDRFLEAEQWMQKALQYSLAYTDKDSTHQSIALVALGQLYIQQRDFSRAEPLLKRALESARRSPQPFREQAGTTGRINLGQLYSAMDQPADAEPLFRKAIESLEKSRSDVVPTVPGLIYALSRLGNTCLNQQRLEDAERYFVRAIRSAEANGLGESAQVVESLVGLAVVRIQSDRPDDAKALFRRVTRILPQSDDSEAWLRTWMNLIAFTKPRNDLDEFNRVMRLLMDSISELERTRPPDDRTLADLSSLVASLIAGFIDVVPVPREELDDAFRLLERSISASPDGQISAHDYETRAMLKWAEGDTDAAMKDLRKAIQAGDQLGIRSAGTGFDVARVFSSFRHPYDRMVSWQSKLGDVSEAFRALEKSRARVLMAELQVSGSDLISTLEPGDEQRLREERQDVRNRMAALKHRVSTAGLSDGDESKLRDLQLALLDVERDIRNSSRAFRLALANDQEPVALSQMEEWVRDNRALFLEYSFGRTFSCRVVVQHDRPSKIEELSLPPKLQQSIEWEGPRVVLESIQQATRINGQPITASLATSEGSKAITDRLHQLWMLLIPAELQSRLSNGEFDLLVVSADGPISNIPFSTLVVEPGNDPLYLVDVGPPVLYSPSGTILANLTAKSRAKANRGATTALSLSVSEFDSAGASDGLLQSTSMTRKFQQYGGALTPLPHTVAESTYVEQVFREYAGIHTRVLRDASATERNLRTSLSGKHFLHVATHGTSSRRFGNLFGGLVLTPGADPTDPDNDGFLSLAEIPMLDLTSCELAVLSACSTNAGPEHQSEGHWGLSRGCIAAGAKRVMATDWVVDDEAAASLVSYFAAGVAQSLGDKQRPDYARSLHAAQKWVRSHDKWSAPHYWGSFVLAGAN